MVAEVLGGWLPLTGRVMAAAAGAAAWASAGGAAAAAVGGTDEVLGVALRLLACKNVQVNTSKIGACGGDDELEPHRRTPAGRATGWSVLKYTARLTP
ncbi:hypothetical protein CHLRE_06g266276v5 [Chlamydomonas reinhardtii]|uniref:Secreted protein n=1 Tax=Chlamydomonas reinhardtii TaxID=3055 RepID=A0A2K3DN20_CHLRE|nr:uncharacterized protein CHLRE_06g266276v5 [Chlamydomonas reinhardtii]PNW81920.1 hypothetical protein CHLRE_06g266276v5 [Chlamydomonas reinhardtii]